MKKTWKVLFSRKVTMIAALFIVALILTAVFADFVAPYGYNDQDLRQRLAPPGAAHLLGTDNYGRDVLSRLIFGSRISLIVAFVSVVVAGVAGSLIGLIAGFCGGVVDGILMRLTDALMTFPTIVFALGISAALGQSTFNLILAIGISTIPPYIRTIRGEVMKVRNQTYIKAARVTGNSVPAAGSCPAELRRAGDRHRVCGIGRRDYDGGDAELSGAGCAAAGDLLGDHGQRGIGFSDYGAPSGFGAGDCDRIGGSRF